MNGSANSDNSLAARSFERILIVKPSSLGDLIHTLPVLHGLRVRYPDARISWLVADPYAALISDHPELDDVIRFDRKLYAMVGRELKPSVAFIDFVRSLRGENFDLAIDVQGLFRSGFLTMASGAAVRIGYTSAREMASMFYTHRVSDDEPDMHAADRYYLLSRTLGFADVAMEFNLAVTGEERRAATRLLSSAGLGAEEPFVAVFPGARWETKRWAGARFAAMIDRVQTDYGIRSVLLAGGDERTLCESIAEGAVSTPVNLAGETGVRGLVAVLERAAVIVAHDSAPMHIAAAMGRPLVAILGPTNPLRTGPYGMGPSVVQADLPCVPCYLKRLDQCGYHHQCMESVEMTDIADRVGRGLARRSNAAGVFPALDRP